MNPFDIDFEDLTPNAALDRQWLLIWCSWLCLFFLTVVPLFYTIVPLWAKVSGAVGFIVLLGLHVMKVASRERLWRRLAFEKIDASVWMLSKKQQMDIGFELTDEFKGFQILRRQIGATTNDYDGDEFIIRNQMETVANAYSIRIHDEASWALRKHDLVEIHGRKISPERIFEGSDVQSRLRKMQQGKSDIICIGLVSAIEALFPNVDSDLLSVQRAKKLGESMLSHGNVNFRASKFSAIGLGAALPTLKGALVTSNDRAAVVIGVIRRMDTSKVSLSDALACVISSSSVHGQKLRDYEYFPEVQKRILQTEIDFKGFV